MPRRTRQELSSVSEDVYMDRACIRVCGIFLCVHMYGDTCWHVWKRVEWGRAPLSSLMEQLSMTMEAILILAREGSLHVTKLPKGLFCRNLFP